MNKTNKLKSLKTELSSRLRREKDSKIVATNPSMPRRHFVQPLQIAAVSRDTLFQWNEKFVIAPFEQDAGIGLTKKKASNEE